MNLKQLPEGDTIFFEYISNPKYDQKLEHFLE